jgi:Asp-tRNA(Asn)/Glu-tRNA(Gln) amidotransferase A subunit family amidase
MAKETKKTAAVVAPTEENIKEVVKNGNLLKDENVQTALENIKKKEDERQVREATNMIMCAKYVNAKELFQLRARRREEKATKEALSKSKELLDKALAGQITPTEYKKEKEKLSEEKRKAIQESNKELDADMSELRNSYTGEYRYMAEWDY